MTLEELRQSAMRCLANAFNGTSTTVPPQTVQAAVSVLMIEEVRLLSLRDEPHRGLAGEAGE